MLGVISTEPIKVVSALIYRVDRSLNLEFVLVRRKLSDPYFPGDWEFPRGRLDQFKTFKDTFKQLILEGFNLIVEEPLYIGSFLAPPVQAKKSPVVFEEFAFLFLDTGLQELIINRDNYLDGDWVNVGQVWNHSLAKHQEAQLLQTEGVDYFSEGV